LTGTYVRPMQQHLPCEISNRTVNMPHLNPSLPRQAGPQFTYPPGMEG